MVSRGEEWTLPNFMNAVYFNLACSYTAPEENVLYKKEATAAEQGSLSPLWCFPLYPLPADHQCQTV